MTFKTKIANHSPEFAKLMESSDEKSERNDCAVMCLALLTGVEYEEAHEVFAKLGRKHRGCSHMFEVIDAFKSLGFELQLDLGGAGQKDLIREAVERLASEKNYNVKNLTTKQMVMFPDLFEHWGDCAILTSGHILAFRDGVVHDWTFSKACRVKGVYRVVRM